MTLAAFAGMAVSPLSANLLDNKFLAGPVAHVQTGDAKQLRASRTIIVPTVYLQVSIDGNVFAAKGAGSSTASAKGKFAVRGLEKDWLMATAQRLQDEWVAQLRAAGWTVLTFADIKDRPDVAAMERQGGGGELPTTGDAGGRTHYVVAAPSDEQNFKPAFQGPVWHFRHLAKAMDANVVVPHFIVMSPQMWTETARGYKRATAEVKTAPGMNLTAANLHTINAKGGGTYYGLKQQVIGTEPIGAFTNQRDETPTTANALSKGLSVLGGGSINRASASYVFAVDAARFDATVTTWAKAFYGVVTKHAKP